MANPKYDVIAIGNAIVDVLAQVDDGFIASQALNKGGMTLIDSERAKQLYADMPRGEEISGGSAANTIVGMADLGCSCAFIGQVSDDQLGEVFRHDIVASKIRFDTPERAGDPPTARCLILVTPDGQRTMNTFLGASQYLPEEALDTNLIGSAGILYLEGYLWDPEEPRKAMRKAIDTIKAAGGKVAFTLSEVFVIDRHRADFIDLIERGDIDILFANEGEIKALAESDDFEKALKAFAGKVPLLVVTRSENGAIAIRDGNRYETEALPTEVVDTTGAGDLFAAGFLTGLVRDEETETCLKMGSVAAAEIISHIGARSKANLNDLMRSKLK